MAANTASVRPRPHQQLLLLRRCDYDVQPRVQAPRRPVPVSYLGTALVTEARPKAIRVQLVDGRQLWIARSVLAPQSRLGSVGDVGELVVERWLSELLREAR